MDCPAINSLRFSENSIRTIRKIKRIPALGNALASVMSGGQVVNIFVGPTPPPVTIYGIQSTDWRNFSRALNSVPPVVRGSIKRLAWSQWMDAQTSKNWEESRFWEAVTNGCKLR